MNNMDIWNDLKTVPPECLKKIGGGRLSGMTDIKPQWRIQAMTSRFGPCGIGWKYEVVKRWTEQGADNQVVAYVDINLYVKDSGAWSEPIPGNGGSMFVAKEKSGLYTSDEAYKMATTDALSSAMKMIGVAADVYMGAFDGSKYTMTTDNLTNSPGEGSEKITDEQHASLSALIDEILTDRTRFDGWVKAQYGLTDIKNLLAKDYNTVVNALEGSRANN